ncbi:MAG: cohesin domain-containing protein [Bacteroidota bacterium]
MKKHYLIFLLFSLLATSSFSQIKPIVEFEVGRQTANVGDTICLPVTVQNFQDVLGIGLEMRWNADALRLIEVQTDFAIPDNPGTNFGITDSDLKWSWISSGFPDGLTLEPNDTIFQVCFVAQNFGAGGFYSVSFDDTFLIPEVILDDQIHPDPIANYNFIPGGIFINGNNGITVTPAFNFSLGCNTYNAGIEAEVSGGVPPYRYTWLGPQSIFSNASRLSNITREGIYNLTVIDSEDNVATAEILVDFMGNESGLPFPEVNTSTQDPDCGESNGSINLDIDADPDSYELMWSTGASSLMVENLSAGIYDVTLTSNNNFCGDSFVFELLPIGAPEVDTLLSNLTCLGDIVEIGITGLNDNFSFLWDTGDTTNIIQVAEPTDYNLTVTDGNCSLTYTLPVLLEQDPPNPNNFFIDDDKLPCGGGSSQIGVSYFGLRTLNYLWSTGESTPQITITQAGNYTLEAIAENGCSTIFEFEIEEEAPDFPITQNTTFLGCGAKATQLSLTPLDATEYEFTWSTAETGSSIDVTTSGLYSATVTEVATACTQVFVFDLEQIDPSLTPITTELECLVENECYQGAILTVNVESTATPIAYTLSNGDSKMGPDSIQFDLFDRLPFDLYIEDAEGCRDTLRNLVPDCTLAGAFPEMRVRQYVVCEPLPDTAAYESILYNEVLGNLSTPPYTFTWGNSFVDTSYFRSSQPLDSLPNLFISVVDQLGFRFDRQLSEAPAAYGCGDITSAVIEAPDVIVSPGESFVYSIHISNHQNLERAVYTIDWDPCLLTVDSFVIVTDDGNRILSEGPFLEGTHETFFSYTDGSPTNDRVLVEDIFFKANADLQGVSPFIFSINEIPLNADGSERIIRVDHGSITVSDGSDLVNPGDANLNGFANHKDVLNIALAFDQSGPDRRNQQVIQSAFGFPWLQATPLSAVDFRNMDCNGDGQVNDQDLNAIEANFSYNPQAGRVIGAEGEIPLYLDADTLLSGQVQSFPIVLGESLLPAEKVYGLAFSIQYDPSIIDGESIEMDLQNSWLFEEGDTPLTFLRVDEANQLIHIAIARTGNTDLNGFGAIANLSFQTIATESGNTSFQVMDATMISADETPILTLNRTTNAAVRTATSTNNLQTLKQKIQLYPNPVRSKLYIEAEGLQIERYSIFDANGRQLSQAIYDRNLIDVETLGVGIYLLRLVTDQGVVTKRFVK